MLLLHNQSLLIRRFPFFRCPTQYLLRCAQRSGMRSASDSVLLLLPSAARKMPVFSHPARSVPSDLQSEFSLSSFGNLPLQVLPSLLIVLYRPAAISVKISFCPKKRLYLHLFRCYNKGNYEREVPSNESIINQRKSSRKRQHLYCPARNGKNLYRKRY